MPVMKLPQQDPEKNWLTQSPSVMDGVWEGPLKGLVKLIYGDGTVGSEMANLTNPIHMGGGFASPLVSIFKDKLERSQATQAFVEKMKGLLPTTNNLATAAEEFAQRYPRVAAHIDPKLMDSIPVSGGNGTAAAAVALPLGRVKNLVEMGITPEGEAAMSQSAKWARDTMFHEGTHVAQVLGNHHTGMAYPLATQAVGYRNNPFEQSARETGKYWSEMLTPPAPGQHEVMNLMPNAMSKGGRTMQGLQQIADSANPLSDDPATLSKMMLGRLLRKRAGVK
jgi:hypothetical protein